MDSQEIARKTESLRIAKAGDHVLDAGGALKAAVCRGVSIPEPAEVAAYLQQHPQLAGNLLEYLDLAAQAGAPGAGLSLELYRDPEIDEEHLVVYIRQQNYSDNLLERIDRVHEELAARSEGAESGWIFVTTDFRPPSL